MEVFALFILKILWITAEAELCEANILFLQNISVFFLIFFTYFAELRNFPLSFHRALFVNLCQKSHFYRIDRQSQNWMKLPKKFNANSLLPQINHFHFSRVLAEARFSCGLTKNHEREYTRPLLPSSRIHYIIY